MKKLLTGSLIFFVLFIFILNFSSDAQIVRDKRLTRQVADGLIYMRGWVGYSNYKNTQETSYLRSEMELKLKDNKYYRIQSIKLNGKKHSYSDFRGGYYTLTISPYSCNVGQTFDLTAVLVKKDASPAIRQVPIIVKLASYRVNNLIKEFSFPAPGQLISLIPRPNPNFTFKWKFTGSPVKSLLRVRKVLGNQVSYTEQTGVYVNIPKNKFEYGKEYNIRLGVYWGGSDFKFTLTRAVTRDSKMDFSNEFYSRFKTKKRILSRLLQKKL